MKILLIGMMTLTSITAKAGGALDHPGFRVNVLTAWGEYYNSSSQAGKEAIKRYIGSLDSTQSNKALTILNLNFDAVQSDAVKTAFTKLNSYCAREDSITEVRISLNPGCGEDDIAYNIRIIGGNQTGVSHCDNVYDMENDISSGKYGYECMGKKIYNSELTKDWFINTTDLIIKRVEKQLSTKQSIEVILNGSH